MRAWSVRRAACESAATIRASGCDSFFTSSARRLIRLCCAVGVRVYVDGDDLRPLTRACLAHRRRA